jgi:hypothetical protein
MSNLQQMKKQDNSPPSMLKLVRIMISIQAIRLAGLQLFIRAGIFPSYFAYPFGAGDLFVGLLALPVAYSLGTRGVRRYALAISWNAVGLADLMFASIVASYAGLNPIIMSDLQTALVVVPVSIVLHLLTITMLLTKPVMQFYSHTGL